jgi:hypothetical protein
VPPFAEKKKKEKKKKEKDELSFQNDRCVARSTCGFGAIGNPCMSSAEKPTTKFCKPPVHRRCPRDMCRGQE